MKPLKAVNAATLKCILFSAISSGRTHMPQWTTFDEDTSSTLRSKLPGETVVELTGMSAIEHALQRGESMVAVLPAHGLGQAGLAVLRWNRIPAATAPPPPPQSEVAPVALAEPEVASPPARSLRATGFLGLTDEVFGDEEEEIQEKKSWWKRFWEE